jgi:hypothetical protein
LYKIVDNKIPPTIAAVLGLCSCPKRMSSPKRQKAAARNHVSTRSDFELLVLQMIENTSKSIHYADVVPFSAAFW